eukprot:gene23901-32297_t
MEAPTLIVEDSISSDLNAAAVKHFRKFSFSSLDFNLRCSTSIDLQIQNRPFHLEQNSLIQELLENKTGSCFHHNALFLAILESSGIQSWMVSCIVRDPLNPERRFDLPSHVAIIFNHGGNEYLFDPGWDGTSLYVHQIPIFPNTLSRLGQYQIRYTHDRDYAYAFEKIREEENSTVIRYEFNLTPSNLSYHKESVEYLNSKHYAFHSLFLYTRIKDDTIFSFVNRRLISRTIDGEEIESTALPTNISVTDKLLEIFGTCEGLIAGLSASMFKNIELGRMICSE